MTQLPLLHSSCGLVPSRALQLMMIRSALLAGLWSISNSPTAYKGMDKRNLIVFPHRIAPEKQVDIFRDLAESMPEYEWVVCPGSNTEQKRIS